MIVDDFIAVTGATMVATFVRYEAPCADNDSWGHFQWVTTLKCCGRAESFPFRLGLAHCRMTSSHWEKGSIPADKHVRLAKGVRVLLPDQCVPCPPSIADVLLSASSDSRCDVPLETWAEELGLSPDSRKAEQTYNACRRMRFAMQRVFGHHFADFETLEEG